MTAYVIPVKFSFNRSQVYRISDDLQSFILHLPTWQIKPQSIIVDVLDGTITITTDRRIPADQLEHLSLSEIL